MSARKYFGLFGKQFSLTGDNASANRAFYGRFRSLTFERLEMRALLAGNIIISEFMASNSTTLKDQDGDSSDWIELYNMGDTPQNLSGWYLTDKASDPTEWAIPNVNLAAGASLIIFASGKNETNPSGELATNFKLSQAGEYLALVRPDMSIATSFNYPPQITDVSYGYAMTQTPYQLVTQSSTDQAYIPTDNSLGLSWTTTSFTPGSNWISGNQGVGYETTGTLYKSLIGTDVSAMKGKNASVYDRITFTAPTDGFSGLTLSVNYDDGFVAYLNGQEVASRNAPANVTWNSKAASNRADSSALTPETIDLSQYASLIQAGQNVLSFQALNDSATGANLVLDAQLTATKANVDTSDPPRYFLTPTPGQNNVAGTNDTRPIVTNVGNTAVSGNGAVTVTATITPAGSPVTGLSLNYVVMFGSTTTVPMFDDGLHGDGTAGDGVYGGVIPAAIAGPGQMVRYFVSATAASGKVGRYPIFSDPTTTTEYLGYVIPNPSVTSDLPIFQLFVKNPTWYRNSNGTINTKVEPADLYYNGHLYDNIHLSPRGDTSVKDEFPIQKLEVDFNDDDPFVYGDGRDPEGAFNLDNMYQDPSYARLTLGTELFRAAGAYAQQDQPVRTQMNGQFYSLGLYDTRIDRSFLKDNGLDPDGAIYKSEGIRDSLGFLEPTPGTLADTSGFKKVQPDNSSFSDLQALVNGVSPSNPHRDQSLYDIINIPEVLDVLAMYAVEKHFDQNAHNYFLYSDPTTGEWSLIPYDLDDIWNRFIGPIYGTTFDGSPFEGSSQDHTWPGEWNRLIDAFVNSPTLSQMLVRRTRTLMDEFLQPPGTPVADQTLVNDINALVAEEEPEAMLDKAKWGQKSGGAWGGPYTVAQGVTQLENGINAVRNYLYNLSIIPPAQVADPDVTFGAMETNPASGNPDEDYIQVVNNSNTAVDISGWTISGSINYTFVQGVVIAAHESVYVSPNVNAFRARTSGPSGNQGLFVQGDYQGTLSPLGGTLALTRTDGTQADLLAYTQSSVTQTVGAFSLPAASPPISQAEFMELFGESSGSVPTVQPQSDTIAHAVSPLSVVSNSGAKYLLNASGTSGINRWYFILPNGNLYLYTGNTSPVANVSFVMGEFIGDFGTAAYGNPSLLSKNKNDALPSHLQVVLSSSLSQSLFN
jgi:spore coat protein CotH